jgi:hypothetical protein
VWLLCGTDVARSLTWQRSRQATEAVVRLGSELTGDTAQTFTPRNLLTNSWTSVSSLVGNLRDVGDFRTGVAGRITAAAFLPPAMLERRVAQGASRAMRSTANAKSRTA